MQDIAIEDLTVAEIMSRWPATIGVFISMRLHCVGCPIAPFHCLADAAFEHGVAADVLVAAVRDELTRAARGGPA